MPEPQAGRGRGACVPRRWQARAGRAPAAAGPAGDWNAPSRRSSSSKWTSWEVRSPARPAGCRARAVAELLPWATCAQDGGGGRWRSSGKQVGKENGLLAPHSPGAMPTRVLLAWGLSRARACWAACRAAPLRCALPPPRGSPTLLTCPRRCQRSRPRRRCSWRSTQSRAAPSRPRSRARRPRPPAATRRGRTCCQRAQ